jgi:Domain of unknown function (DUF5753)
MPRGGPGTDAQRRTRFTSAVCSPEAMPWHRLVRRDERAQAYGRQRPVAFFRYLEYEAAAAVVREYESFLIPGLLQTEQYAATVISNTRETIVLRPFALGSRSACSASSLSSSPILGCISSWMRR